MSYGQLHHGSFGTLEFPKTGKEIKEHAVKKSQKLKAKVEERKGRIQSTITAKGISAIDILANLESFGAGTYMPNSNSPVGAAAGTVFTAGEQQQVQREAQLIKSETDEADKLDLIARNLSDSASFKLSFTDLEYLEF